MKGITGVIGIVLTIMLTVSLVSYFYLGLSRIADSANRFAENASENVFNQLGASIKIDSATRTAVYVRNDGSSTIANYTVALYVDRANRAFALANDIAPGEVAMLVTGSMSAGYHEIKVTAGSGASDYAYVMLE